MITCREREELVERRLDGETTAGDERLLSEHLEACESCRLLFERETALHAALTAHFAGAEPGPQFLRRVLRRVHGEDAGERLEWVADALNATGSMATLALATWVLGRSEPATLRAVLVWVGSALAVGCYPWLLAHWASDERVGLP